MCSMIQLAHTNNRNTGDPASAVCLGLQRLYRGAVDSECEPEPGATDHLFGPGRAPATRWQFSASCSPRARFPVPCSQRLRSLRRRANRSPRSLLVRLSSNLNLNSSDSRELDEIQLRLGDGEAGTVRSGHAISHPDFLVLIGHIEQYSEYPWVNRRGSLGSLTSLLSNLAGSAVQHST